MDRIFLKFKGAVNSLNQRAEVLESLLSYLIDKDTKTLLRLYEKDQIFPLILNFFFENHLLLTPQDSAVLLPHTE